MFTELLCFSQMSDNTWDLLLRWETFHFNTIVNYRHCIYRLYHVFLPTRPQAYTPPDWHLPNDAPDWHTPQLTCLQLTGPWLTHSRTNTPPTGTPPTVCVSVSHSWLTHPWLENGAQRTFGVPHSEFRLCGGVGVRSTRYSDLSDMTWAGCTLTVRNIFINNWK